MATFISFLGKRTLDFISALGQIILLFWKALGSVRWFHHDRVLYVQQMYKLGIKALPLVGIVSVFAGAVSGWQGAYQLADTLPKSFFGQIVPIGILSEMGPVLVALVLAGRNGSSISAEIATMKVTEQVDALEAMAIDPVRYLVTPRVISMIILMPLLILVGDFVAIFTAGAIGDWFFDINLTMYFNSFQSVFVMTEDFLPSVYKGLFFGLSISLVSCWVGLHSERGASGVGRAAINAFVYSATLVLANDYLVAVIVY